MSTTSIDKAPGDELQAPSLSSLHARPRSPERSAATIDVRRTSTHSLPAPGRFLAATASLHETDIGIALQPISSKINKAGRTANTPDRDTAQQPEFNMTNAAEWRFLGTLCFCLIMAGWNDATLGPLLPRIQAVYHINYTVVSMLFVTGCAGVLTGAGLNIYLTDRFGIGKLVAVATLIQTGMYGILAAALPFPVFCVAYFIIGACVAIQDAQCSTFIASIPRNALRNMGILHSMYGLGAFMSPLIATQFAQLPRWSFHFLVSMGLSICNFSNLVLTFKLKPQSHFITHSPYHQNDTLSSGNKYRQIFTQRSVILMSLFLLFVVGAGVTISGWSYTYLLVERKASPSAGYVSSGYFGGVSLGRLFLLPLNAKIGVVRAVYVYSMLCLGLQFTVWFVPNLYENAVAISVMGFLAGPFYPIAMNVTTDLVPSRLLAGSIGCIAAFGQAGAAIFPFMSGALASKYTVKVIQPLLVALMVVETMIWYFVTHSKVSRTD